MKAKELLHLIPDEELEFLAAESKVDRQVKKLRGITIFQLILFSMLHTDKPSLRVMETIFHSMQFRIISGLTDETTRFNSIRDRIATINSNFFERLFSTVFDKFNKYFGEEDALIRYDSTMVAISSKLVEWGMRVGSKTNKVQLKYTIGMKGSFPCQVSVYDKPEALSEDKTIPQAILSNATSTSGIVVFDRGVQARKAYEQLTKRKRLFVTRANPSIRYRILKRLKIAPTLKQETTNIQQDLIVQLRGDRGKWETTKLRLVRGVINATGEVIYFLTNIESLSAYEIAAIYKQRWDIEALFKFLKQHLNLSHLVARNTNGIRVMIYMTLLLAILLIAYKKLNKLSSYKIAKLQFSQNLETDIVKQIVLLCGGDPLKLKYLFNDS